MNTPYWIHHFETNTEKNRALEFPKTPCSLPEAVRKPLAKSLAVFQLGESGSGSRIRRCCHDARIGADLRGYPEAVDRFIKEEQSHSYLLARAVEHLGGRLLTKQWTNSVFQRLRFLLNLDFTIQMLLTAELIAEVYYGLLYLHCDDPVVRCLAQKILQDETRHLAFQRDFFRVRVARLSPVVRWFWRLQFRAVHALTVLVVAWDHRHALRALGLSPGAFRTRCGKAWQRFSARLERALAREARGPAGTAREEPWSPRTDYCGL
ncbi:MAG: hypothetical protein RLZZ244_1048 [Verrucomicrobiota bacterium]|jgi:hypothetical protein